MAGTPYLIDSNILIRWVQPSDPDYPIVESALEALANQGAILCYTSQNVAEFWSACTRPAGRNGYGLLPQEADQRARLFESRLRLLADNLAIHQEWRRLIVKHKVSGVRVPYVPSLVGVILDGRRRKPCCHPSHVASRSPRHDHVLLACPQAAEECRSGHGAGGAYGQTGATTGAGGNDAVMSWIGNLCIMIDLPHNVGA
jgi:hypothetical protein